MRILHVVSSINKAGGGVSEVVPRLAMEQCRLGNEVTLATIVSEMSESTKAAIAAGVKYEGKSHVTCLTPDALGFSFEFRRTLLPLVQMSDIIHLHGLWLYPLWCAGWLAQKLHKPYLMMPHGSLSPASLKKSYWKKMIVGRLIERPLLKRSNAIVATSQSEENAIRAYGLSNPVHIMPIGLDCEPIDQGRRNDLLLKSIGCDPGKKHLLYFSRISPMKGLDLLAEAWNDLKDDRWQLIIVGPDDRGYTGEVRRLYEKHILKGSVVMHGPIYGMDKYDILKSVDAFVLPSRSENWSIAVAEALAAQLPVLCAKGAPWQCINEIGAGFWVDVNVEGVLDGLRRIFGMNDSQRCAMGANGRKWVEDNLRWNVIAENIIGFYKQICEAK